MAASANVNSEADDRAVHQSAIRNAVVGANRPNRFRLDMGRLAGLSKFGTVTGTLRSDSQTVPPNGYSSLSEVTEGLTVKSWLRPCIYPDRNSLQRT